MKVTAPDFRRECRRSAQESKVLALEVELLFLLFKSRHPPPQIVGGLTRRSTCRGRASARRPSRLVKSKSERRRAACIARLTCRQAARRAAAATWALAAQVNV